MLWSLESALEQLKLSSSTVSDMYKPILELIFSSFFSFTVHKNNDLETSPEP